MARCFSSIALGLLLQAGLVTTESPVFAATEQPLAFATRVDCRTAIEDVNWRSRIWPESNPAPKPPLSEIASNADISDLVAESMARSVALEEYWRTPLTGEMLQAELVRMAASSRRPAVLEELFAALGRDPVLAAECLARPILADRLLRERFAADERFADLEFADWWATARPVVGDILPVLASSYRLPTISASVSASDGWTDTAAIPLDNTPGDVVGTAVWTGTEMVYFGNFNYEAYRYAPATDSWQTTSTLGGPLGLRDTTAVWTGTYVVASNGCTANNHNCTTSLAWRYDPLVDLWEPIPNAPISRTDQSAVWTGTEMLVWGGCTYAQDVCQFFSQTGARYDPAANSWQTMSSTGAPLGRTYPNLVWTGTEMIVWGGRTGSVSGGGRYDPATDSWSGLSTTNAPNGANSAAVWSGAEMIAWGGCTGTPFCDTWYDTGARYDPDSDTWTPTSTAGTPVGRSGHASVWIGDEMFVWGGYDGSDSLGDGARYDPTTDSWSPVSATGAPSPRRNHQMLWTDSLVLVWGGATSSFGTDMRTGGRYDPVADSWGPIDTTDPDALRAYHMAVWTGAEMIVWGGLGDGLSGGLNTGRIYDPATDSWSATTTAGAPSGAYNASAVWTGSEMIVWGGQSGTLVRDTGARYDPVTDSWTAMAPSEGRTQNAHVWTGTEMVVWGGSTWSDIWSNTGARYDPASNSWSPVATAGAPAGRKNLGGFVWTGEAMLVWGGFGSSGEVGTGGRYDPASNSWAVISNANAPAARFGHVAVWSGDEMIVWGGMDYSTNDFYDTGGRYHPATDTWSATSTVDAPLPARSAKAVWSGSEMIVWGGECDQPGLLTCHSESYEGGRYDPQTDTWTPTTLDGVPEARIFHSAVWTGDTMIVWGGLGTWSGYRHTGGVYSVEGGGIGTFGLVPETTAISQCGFADIDLGIGVTQIGAFDQPVSLGTANLPAGVTSSFTVDPVTPPGSTVLTLGNLAGAGFGEHAFQIEGSGGGQDRSVGIGLSLADVPSGTGITAPADGAVDVSVTPTVVWTAAAEASQYRLQIARDAAFTDIVYTRLATGTSHQVATPLAAGESYNLRVRALNDCGTGGWSAVISFTTEALLVLAPAGFEADFSVFGSNGNFIFEPGETVEVAPWWRNDGATGSVVTGTVTSFAGPAGATYSVDVDQADYGMLAPGVTASCQATGACYQLHTEAPANRPVLHWDAELTEEISGGMVKTWKLHIGESFTDVPPGHPFYGFVETLLHHGVTVGCGGGGYCPQSSASRAQMPVFVLVAGEGSGFAPPACVPGSEAFADVPASSPFCPWVEELFDRGIVAGCGGGNYCPNDPVTRAQMAVFTLATLEGPGYAPPACAPGSEAFADVPASSPFCPWVEELFDRGIVAGCGSGNYCPGDPVTRGQMGVFISATFGLELYAP